MQELVPLKLSRAAVNLPGGGRHAYADETVLTEIEEAVDDLAELQHLISFLTNESENESDFAESKLQQRIQLLQARQQRQLDLVERASRWGDSQELKSILATLRQEYIESKTLLRTAYRQRGAMLCAYDWQSPVYAATVALGYNRLNQGIAEHSLDYKRDGHLDAMGYEEAFLAEYLSHLRAPGGEHLNKAYLANSGMAAFTTILHWLAHEADLGRQALALQPMYFENLHLARAFFPHIVQLDTPTTDELLAHLQKEQPSLVICDAVSNCGEVLAPDLQTILHWAQEATHELALVVDTTCLPLPLLSAGLLNGLPANVCVLFVESLAKHHQFGMDAVTGGIVVAHMKHEWQESFRKTRARSGSNISDSSVGALPWPNRQRLTRRMRRHSRNISLLAQALQEQPAGALESVSWLQEPSALCPWYRGSCLTIRLRKGFRSLSVYQQFEHKVLELCQEYEHPISFGTSFGFDLCRLYVTAPSTRFEEPFLRIAVGTETRAEIEQLIEILKLAGVAIANRLPERASPPAAAPVSYSPTSLRTANVNSDKTNLAASVFSGQDGLKNYLTPANYAPTPLVELPGDLNPFREDGVRLFAKMMPLVPLMNIKSIPAFSMLNKAAERGDLQGVKTIIESSSSNTVLSLSVIGKLFGVDKTCAIVDHSIAPSLTRMLRLFGIEIFLHPAAGHELFGRLEPRSERAANCGRQEGWINPGQYTNPDNPEGFARWLAPDLWAQTEGKLSLLACALGTCGTMVGVSRALRERNPQLQVVACYPQAGQAVPGPREKALLADVTFPWQTVANDTVELSAQESFAASVQLLRRGILGGPSSGMNYAGVLRYLQKEKESGRLQEAVQAAKGELWSVFLCCDSPLPHVDEYYEALGQEFFPTIHDVPQPAMVADGLSGADVDVVNASLAPAKLNIVAPGKHRIARTISKHGSLRCRTGKVGAGK